MSPNVKKAVVAALALSGSGVLVFIRAQNDDGITVVGLPDGGVEVVDGGAVLEYCPSSNGLIARGGDCPP